MKIIARLIGIAGFSAALAGCTTSLSTRPDVAHTTSDKALPGVAYSLPMLQYEIKTTYKIVDCPRDASGADPATKLEIVVEPTATSDYIAGERYVIDYMALVNIFKVTDFAIETYEGSGTLRTINASAEDKTGDVIKSVVDTAISGASMIAGNPLAVAQSTDSTSVKIKALIDQAGQSRQLLICTPEAIQLADALSAARKRVKALMIELDQGSKEADTITVRATLKLGAANDGADLLKLHSAQLARSKELIAFQGEIAENEAKLSFSETIRWPMSFNQIDGPITGSARLKAWAMKWLDVDPTPYQVTDRTALEAVAKALLAAKADDPVALGLQKEIANIADDPGCKTGESVDTCARRSIGLHASLQTDQEAIQPCVTGQDGPLVDCSTEIGVISARDGPADKGIFVREPIRAQLLLCGRNVGCAKTAEKPLFEGKMVMAPQLGQLRFLPLSNGSFQNNALSLSLRTDGGITKMQYSEKSAIAATALASIAASAGKMDEYLKKRDEEREKAIDDAKADVTVERVEAKAVRDDEIAQLQYQIDKATKEKAIFDQANPPVPEASPVSTELKNENLRLQAELTRLTALVAIKKAEKEYAQ